MEGCRRLVFRERVAVGIGYRVGSCSRRRSHSNRFLRVILLENRIRDQTNHHDILAAGPVIVVEGVDAVMEAVVTAGVVVIAAEAMVIVVVAFAF